MLLKAAVAFRYFIAIIGVVATTSAQASFTEKYDASIKRSVEHYWGDFPIWHLFKAQLVAESGLDPNICSAAGACGLAQFMEPTWEDTLRRIGADPTTSRFDARTAIDAGAFYMSRLRLEWAGRNRARIDAHDLGLASYNAGIKSVLDAQRLCSDGLLWAQVAPCMVDVTGAEHARETLGYVARIHDYFNQMSMEHP